MPSHVAQEYDPDPFRPGICRPGGSLVLNVAFLLDGGSFAPAPFLAAVSANKLVAGITWDVYLAAAAFSVWVLQDAPAAGIRRPWIYVALAFGVGLAFALPLYFALRQVGR